jgi:DNA-binding transcriptional LysR family regulator
MGALKREYEHFMLLTETLNISRAAQTAGVQQAGLSKSLQRLEASLGEKLFVRRKTGLHLTEHGEMLRDAILEMQDNWEKRLVEFETLSTEPSGFFQIAAHETLAADFLNSVISRLAEDFPKMQIHYHFCGSKVAALSVAQAKWDLALAINPAPYPELVISRLHQIGIYAWSRKKSGNPNVVYFNPDLINIEKAMRPFGEYRQIPVHNYEVLVNVSRHSDAIFIFPDHIAARNPALHCLGKRLVTLNLCLIHRYDRSRTRGFETIVSAVKERVKRQVRAN